MHPLFLLFPLLFLISCSQCTSQTTRAGAEKKSQQSEFIASASDSVFYDEVKKEILTNISGSGSLKFNDLIIITAKSFLGTPYVSSSLEINERETLIVDLRRVDCSTFVEYVLAFAYSLKKGETEFGDLASELQCLRYRDGQINGYASRLHYFSEWLKDNEANGYLKLVSDSLGNESMDMKLNFMSTHPELYAPLNKNPELVEEIKSIEENISLNKMNYISKGNIDNVQAYIENGDIIAFVTKVKGLDVSHTGFACFVNERLHILHASTRTNQVEISPVPLSNYIKNMSSVSGILVARPVYR